MLRRLVMLLDLLASSDMPITLREAYEKVHINKPSLMRLLKSMAEENLASQPDGFEGYTLGPKVFSWAGAYLKNLNLLTVSQNGMRALRDESNESVVLSILRGFSRVVISGEFPSREVLSHFEIGVTIPLPYGAAGKAITAFLEPNALEGLLSKPIKPLTKATVSNPQALRAECRKIQKTFLAVSKGERSSEIWAIASPVFNHANQVIGSLALVCPRYRFKAVKRCQKSLINLARDISFQMGSSMRFP